MIEHTSLSSNTEETLHDAQILREYQHTLDLLTARVSRFNDELTQNGRSPDALLDRAKAAEAQLIISNTALQALGRLAETSAQNLRISDAALRALALSSEQGNEKLRVSELALLALTKLTDGTREAMHVSGVALEAFNKLAFYDPLTNLPNRRLLLDRLKQAISTTVRTKQFGALIYIDLDNFKTINDTMGHTIGDQLLEIVSTRLVQCVRESDSVARMGGDEFVILLEGLGKNIEIAATDARNLAEKILAVLGFDFQLDNYLCQVTSSIGIALFSGDRNDTVEDVLKQSDLAMYEAKSGGRNTLRFYDSTMQAFVLERVQLIADLRMALKQDQFCLFYQVQVDDKGHACGSEVLLRWQHPTRGLLLPDQFISCAEDTGLILEIGSRVLTKACHQLALWAGDPVMANLMLSVNVSARQFRQADFVQQVVSTLAQENADPSHLTLELTESILIADAQDAVLKICALKGHGVHFSLDDFGTGYSSLSYLQHLPLDEIKIDKSFVDEIHVSPSSHAIVRTILALGNTLGFGVIAEGVETQEQRDVLASNGCRSFQGYLYSRPVPLKNFTAVVRELQPGIAG